MAHTSCSNRRAYSSRTTPLPEASIISWQNSSVMAFQHGCGNFPQVGGGGGQLLPLDLGKVSRMMPGGEAENL